MGNGFPVAGVLAAPQIQAWHGMLGTTFGGNHLACAAAIAVLDVIRSENLIANAGLQGAYFRHKLSGFTNVKEIRGRGLMIGLELNVPCSSLRNELLSEHRIFTGSSSCKNTLRILPALNIQKEELDEFIDAFVYVNSKTLVL